LGESGKDGVGRETRVFVDAKILNMHDPALPKNAFVGWIDESGNSGARQEEATESDDAEILAILFAIEVFDGLPGRLVVICDHQSVVSEANRDAVKRPGELMKELRRVIQERRRAGNPEVELRALQANPAHGVVTDYVNLVRGQGG
jgi:hypothetical protein